ncbi:hypothetical protein, partial [Campylobacter jejuni]
MYNYKIRNFKKNFSSLSQSCRKFFLKQGAFSLYHSKNMDNFIKKAYDIV